LNQCKSPVLNHVDSSLIIRRAADRHPVWRRDPDWAIELIRRRLLK
jgi:hypothetical protein